MFLKNYFFLICIALLLPQLVLAQGGEAILDGSYARLTEDCAEFNGLNAMPDGTIIQIRWDQTANGADISDPLLTVGTGLGQWNFNQFALNGVAALNRPGAFFPAQALMSVGSLTQSRIFLAVMQPNNIDFRWWSGVFVLNSGFNYIYADSIGGNWQCQLLMCSPDFTLSAPGTFSSTTCGAGDDCNLRLGTDRIVEVNIFTTGSYTFSLCGSSMNWDSYMYVSTGCCSGTILAENDDACATSATHPVINCLLLNAGTYYVAIEPWGAPTCNSFTLNVTSCGLPGDNCGSVIEIDSLPFFDTGNTSGYTDNFNALGNTSPDVIYSFVAPDSGMYLISLCGSDYNTLLEVRTGGACPGDSLVSVNDDACSPDSASASALTVLLSASTSYFVIVDGSGTADAGNYVLNLFALGCSQPCPQCDPSDPNCPPQAAFPLECGELVVTCASGNNNTMPVGTRPVVGVVDMRTPPAPCLGPTWTNWAAPMFHPLPDWDHNHLGEVFGLTLDHASPPNIYVTATTCYGYFGANTFGPGGFTAAGRVYKLSGTTGSVTPFADLPQYPAGIDGVGLGNICYDEVNNRFYVTNMEDGKIYCLSGSGAPIPTATYDPFGADLGASDPGFAPFGERLWGIEVFNGRVYFSRWWENTGAINPINNNEVWSVPIVPATGSLDGSMLQLELTLTASNRPNPISDINFSSAGRMLIAQRSMLFGSGMVPTAHQAAVLEFTGPVWVPSTQSFHVGQSNGTNCAGGASYDYNPCASGGWDVYATCDFIRNVVYGVQKAPCGGTSLNSSAGNYVNNVCYYVDLDCEITNQDKFLIGEVDVVTHCDTLSQCCYCDSSGTTQCAMTSSAGCQALNGVWTPNLTCSDPCTRIPGIDIDNPGGIAVTCSSGVIIPNPYIVSANIYNHQTSDCFDVSVSLHITGTSGVTGTVLNSPISLGNMSGQIGTSVAFNVQLNSVSPAGGRICYSMISHSSTCCTDSVFFCDTIPPCPCPHPNQDFEPINDLCNTAYSYDFCDTLCGTIDSSGDVDYYGIYLNYSPCTRITVDAFGHDTPNQHPVGQGLNPMVSLLQAPPNCSQVVVTDFDSGFLDDAYFSECVRPGLYYIRVQSENGTSGPYILQIVCDTCVCDTCPYPNFDYEPLNDVCWREVGTFCDTCSCGEIEDSTDADNYFLHLNNPYPGQCVELIVNVYADATPGKYPHTKGLNPKVTIRHAATVFPFGCDAVIATDNNSGIGTDSYVAACVRPNSDYFISVESVGGTDGPYIICVECICCECSPICEDSCSQQLSNLQNWWPLDETVGPYQEIVNDRDASTPFGFLVPTSVSGVVGGALGFNGNNYVTSANNILNSVGGSSFTLDCWVYPSTADGFARTIAGKETNTRGYQLFMSHGQIFARVSSPSGTAIVGTTAPVTLNQWYFVAMTFENNPGVNTDILSLFVCNPTGSSPAVQPPLATTQSNLDVNSYFGIADVARTLDIRFIGRIDEVELWRGRALSAQQLQDICAHGKCKEVCHVPWDRIFCYGSNTVEVGLQICNFKATAQLYNWSVTGVTPYTWQCPYTPPPADSGPPGWDPLGTVPAGSCVTIPLTITAPPGLGGNDVSCYQVMFTNDQTGESFCCHGSVWGRRRWCPDIPIAYRLDCALIPVGVDTTIIIPITNDSDSIGVFNYTLEVMSPDPLVPGVMINGLSAGTNYEGTLNIPLGQTGQLPIQLQFTEAQPLGFYDLMIGWDESGDNVPEFPTSICLQSLNELPAPEPPVITAIRAIGPGEIQLDWEADAFAMSYNVYVSDVGPDGPWTLVGTTALNTYLDTGAIASQLKRFYQVTAEGTASDSLSFPVDTRNLK